MNSVLASFFRSTFASVLKMPMEARRCQIQPENHSERLVNELRNNQSENNDEEDR